MRGTHRPASRELVGAGECRARLGRGVGSARFRLWNGRGRSRHGGRATVDRRPLGIRTRGGFGRAVGIRALHVVLDGVDCGAPPARQLGTATVGSRRRTAGRLEQRSSRFVLGRWHLLGAGAHVPGRRAIGRRVPGGVARWRRRGSRSCLRSLVCAAAGDAGRGHAGAGGPRRQRRVCPAGSVGHGVLDRIVRGHARSRGGGRPVVRLVRGHVAVDRHRNGWLRTRMAGPVPVDRTQHVRKRNDG